MAATDHPTTPNMKAPPPAAKAVAVALKAEWDDRAPKVIAAGRGSVAEQILEIAFAKGVKVREDADLAELLSAIDIDSDIPLEAFAAVAEILTYVYRANAESPETARPAPDPAAWAGDNQADGEPR